MMNCPLRGWLLAVCSLGGAGLGQTPEIRADTAAPVPGVVAPGYEVVASELTRRIRYEIVDKGLPGFVIALRDGEDVVWRAGFGAAHGEGAAAMPTDPGWRCASISKLFTAVLAMQLAAEGRLDLDRPVVELVPEFTPDNPFGEPVTVRHLLGHRAGVVREPPVGHYFDGSGPTLAAMVESLADTRLVTRPGTHFAYSNAGLGVAGRVVEAVLGMPFEAAVAERIFRPLGMAGSSFAPWAAGDAAPVSGRMWTYDRRAIPCPVFPFGYGPAANLRAPMVDLLAFAGSQFQGSHRYGPQLLAGADWEQMWTPVAGSRCGLGFFVRREGEQLSVGHGGAVYGFATQLEVLPTEGLAVAAGCNLDMGNAVVRAVVEQAVALLRARRAGASVAAVARPQPLGVDAARSMEGIYRSGGDRVQLLARGDELVLVPDLGTAVRIRVLGGELITDDRTSLGAPLAGAGWRGSDRAELTWRGRPWRRDGEAVGLPPPAPEALRPYLGEYGWDHNRLVVFERDGALATLIEWLVYCPVAATSEPGTFRLDERSMYSGELLRFVPAATGAEGLWLGGCWLPRVADHEPDTSFRIRPLHDAASLRRLAAQARAPRPPANALPADLVELSALDPTLRYDVRYATDNNFMGMAFYDAPAVRLQRPAARALIECQRRLAAAGLGLVLYDGYRPWTVTKMFFDATPVAQRMFVADPANGSRHNRGCAIDLGLVDRRTGEVLPMVSGYDEFSPKASPDYPGSTSRRRALRELLRRTMEEQGFEVYEHEWWHFDYRDWGRYPVLDER